MTLLWFRTILWAAVAGVNHYCSERFVGYTAAFFSGIYFAAAAIALVGVLRIAAIEVIIRCHELFKRTP